MRSAFRIFFQSPGTSPWGVLLALTVASLFEMLGLGALLPLFSLAGGQEAGEVPRLGQIATATLDSMGIAVGIAQLILLLVAAYLVKFLMTFAALTYAGFAEADLSARIRTRLLESIFASRWQYLVGRKTGEFTNELNNNAARAGHAYQLAARSLTYFVQACFYLFAAILISPQLTALIIVVGVVFYFLFAVLIRKSAAVGQRQTTLMAAMSTLVADTLGNIKPIRAMNRQDQILATVHDQNRLLRSAARRLAIIGSAAYTGSDAFVVMVMGAGLFVATVWLAIPFADVAVLAIVAVRGIETLKQTQNFLRSTAEVESAYFSTQEHIKTLSSVRESHAGTKVPTLRTDCRFDHVSFRYDSAPLIEDVSLTIPANDITVLIGPSGAGKTSIVDLLMGLFAPTSGAIYVDDTPMDQIDLRQWRGSIGYVPQETTLLHGTLRQNLTLGDTSISDETIEEALRLAGADRFIASLKDGLETIAGEMGARFSGGQRQRIALARALVLNPKLLILDEVTSALDPKTEAEICANIQALKGSLTIVAVTHRDAWTSIAGRIYEVNDGRVSESPPSRSLARAVE